MADPHISTVIKDFATAAALLAGGGWALWTWGHGEKLRRNREMAATDGNLTATSVDMDESKSVVTLQAIWRNRGPVALKLCPSHTRVEVFRLEKREAPSRLELTESPGVHLIVSAVPTWNSYIMEPSTDSVMHEHFVLAKGSLYAFRWLICLAPGSIPGTDEEAHLVCTREMIWSDQAPIVSVAVS